MPAIVFITNSTKIVQNAKRIHTLVAYTTECVEDSANLAYLPIDILLFGQPIQVDLTSSKISLIHLIFKNNMSKFLLHGD